MFTPHTFLHLGAGRLFTYPMATMGWVDAESCVGAISNGAQLTDAVGPEMNFGRCVGVEGGVCEGVWGRS